ncbi:MAG: hypothetical protein AB1410_01025 [Acidobacteriota bacterium]
MLDNLLLILFLKFFIISGQVKDEPTWNLTLEMECKGEWKIYENSIVESGNYYLHMIWNGWMVKDNGDFSLVGHKEENSKMGERLISWKVTQKKGEKINDVSEEITPLIEEGIILPRDEKLFFIFKICFLSKSGARIPQIKSIPPIQFYGYEFIKPSINYSDHLIEGKNCLDVRRDEILSFKKIEKKILWKWKKEIERNIACWHTVKVNFEIYL